jgi:hypothetical protein
MPFPKFVVEGNKKSLISVSSITIRKEVALSMPKEQQKEDAGHSGTRGGSPAREEGEGSPARRLTAEDVERLNGRLYTQAIENQKQNMEKLEQKYYKTAEPKVLAKEEIDASVARQVNAEMERRSKRNEELSTKHYKDEETKKMTAAELEDSVGRIYSEAIRQKEAKKEQLEAKHKFKNKSAGKKISKEDAAASGARLAVPKKKEFSVEEINKIYGF